MANTPKFPRNGAVGFIDWLDGLLITADKDKTANERGAVCDPHRNAMPIAVPPKNARYFGAATMLTDEILPVTFVAVDRVPAVGSSNRDEREEINHRDDDYNAKPDGDVPPLQRMPCARVVHFPSNERELSHR